MKQTLLILIMALACSSCMEVDCEKLVSIVLPKKCNIVVHNTPERGRRFNIKGINPITKQSTSYRDIDTWYVYFNDKIEIGDTVVKRQGELKFYIHKKDTILVIPYICGGKAYE